MINIESALETIVNITEIGGYLKNEKREEIIKAVSDLKNCFDKITNSTEEENSEKYTPDNEVRERRTQDTPEGGDGRTEGQAAPSVNNTHKTPDDFQTL